MPAGSFTHSPGMLSVCWAVFTAEASPHPAVAAVAVSAHADFTVPAASAHSLDLEAEAVSSSHLPQQSSLDVLVPPQHSPSAFSAVLLFSASPEQHDSAFSAFAVASVLVLATVTTSVDFAASAVAEQQVLAFSPFLFSVAMSINPLPARTKTLSTREITIFFMVVNPWFG